MGASHHGRPAQLGNDDVIRFADADHFLEELAGNLGRGRAFVRSARVFALDTRIRIGVEAPGSSRRVIMEAIVVFARDGYVGLEVSDFRRHARALDELGRSVRGHIEPKGDDDLITGKLDAPPDWARHDEASEHQQPLPGPGSEGPATPPRRPPSLPAELLGPPEPAGAEASTGDPSGGSTLGEDLTRTLSAYLADESPPRPMPVPRIDAPPTPRVRGDTVVEAPDLSWLLEPSAAPDPPAQASSRGPSPAQASSRGPSPAQASSRGPSPAPPVSGPPPSAEADEKSLVPAQGLDALADAALLRASIGGVIRASEPSHWLELWLTGLRKGHLSLLGGPEGAPGERVRLKLVGDRVLTVSARVIARVGPWLTVAIEDPPLVQQWVEESAQHWRSAAEPLLCASGGIDPVGPESKPLVSSRPRPVPASADPVGPESKPLVSSRPRPVPSSSDDHPPRPSSSTPGPLSDPSLAMGPESAGVNASRGFLRLPEPERPDEPPEAPRLEGHRVVFRHAADLRRELEVDIQNGGLFVVAPALPIRTRKRLELVVGNVTLPFAVDADVVYADGNRVGFSLSESGALCSALRALLEGNREHGFDPGPTEPQGPPEAHPASGELAGPPSTDALLGFSARRTGDLEALQVPSVLSLFDELVASRFRGVLRLWSSQGQRTVFFHDGNVAFLEANPFDEPTSLGRILAHHRRLSESGLRRGLQKARQSHKPLGRSLIGLGLAKSSDILSALREQTRARLERAFGWSEGHYELSDWRDPPGRGDLVVTRGLGILAHHMRHRFEPLGPAQLEALLKPIWHAKAQSASVLEETSHALGLPPKEVRFLQVSLDGRSLAEAVRVSPLPRLASLRLAATALALGLIRVEGSRFPTARPAPRRDSSEQAARMRRDLQAKIDALGRQNYFDVLGVHWSAHPKTFADAYERVLAEYSTVKGPYRSSTADVQSLARKCSQRVKEAFDILSDSNQRQAYRHQLFDATDLEYAAQMLVEKGEVALMRGDRPEAIEHLETAVELAPSDRNRALLRAAREGRR